MTSVTLRDVHNQFLSWLEDWHRVQHWEADYRALARLLDVPVKEGLRSGYNSLKRTITVRAGLHPHRERHEGLHEVAHHLFRHGEGGHFFAQSQALVPEKHRARKDIEEGIVRAAGFQLLIPNPHLREIWEECGDNTERMVRLAKARRTSFGLAGRRVIKELTYPVRGMVISSRGAVLDSFGNDIGVARYLPGTDFTVPATHALRQPLPDSECVTFQAPIPFKVSRRHWPTRTEAWYDPGRHQTLALFDGRRLQHQGMEGLFPQLFGKR